VAIQTLERPQLARPRIRRPVQLNVGRKPVLRDNPTPAKMQEVEDRLLASAIAQHPGRERAFTHLLSAVERDAVVGATSRSSMLTASPAHTQTMEDLLFEAIVRTHRNCEDGLNRLLGDVVGDAAIDDTEESDAALSEMRVDNDFDGLS
jgi:hypothetical protein